MLKDKSAKPNSWKQEYKPVAFGNKSSTQLLMETWTLKNSLLLILFKSEKIFSNRSTVVLMYNIVLLLEVSNIALVFIDLSIVGKQSIRSRMYSIIDVQKAQINPCFINKERLKGSKVLQHFWLRVSRFARRLFFESGSLCFEKN